MQKHLLIILNSNIEIHKSEDLTIAEWADKYF